MAYASCGPTLPVTLTCHNVVSDLIRSNRYIASRRIGVLIAVSIMQGQDLT